MAFGPPKTHPCRHHCVAHEHFRLEWNGSSDGGPAEGGPIPGTKCAHDSACKTDQVCAFPQAELCSAIGQCFPKPSATCGAYMAGRACDGTEIDLICQGLPDGYVTQPIKHTGHC